jgi:hypothetical protein
MQFLRADADRDFRLLTVDMMVCSYGRDYENTRSRLVSFLLLDGQQLPLIVLEAKPKKNGPLGGIG